MKIGCSGFLRPDLILSGKKQHNRCFQSYMTYKATIIKNHLSTLGRVTIVFSYIHWMDVLHRPASVDFFEFVSVAVLLPNLGAAMTSPPNVSGPPGPPVGRKKNHELLKVKTWNISKCSNMYIRIYVYIYIDIHIYMYIMHIHVYNIHIFLLKYLIID